MMETLTDYPNGQPSRRERILACLLGGAVGDALGAPVEFMGIDEIRRRYGSEGVNQYEMAYGRRGAITDDTQMTLFTAEGLILTTVRAEYQAAPITAIYHAYLRWLYTQDIEGQNQLIKTHGTCSVVDGILTGHPSLFSRRAPGQSCLSALRSGRMGSMDRPLNDSKGCGGIMRVAPIGLACTDAESAFRMGCQAAAITHGHPTGVLAAGFLAALISRLASGDPLAEALDDASRLLTRNADAEECMHAIQQAMDLSRRCEPSPAVVERLGAGWVAEEALAIGLYCALVAGDDYRKGVTLAVNHSGDSDSTGAIAGNMIGVRYGRRVIPSRWMADLEMNDLIEEMATDLYERFSESAEKK